MARTSTYLNFQRHTLEVFEFYQSVFGGELQNVMRIGDMPQMEGMPILAEEDKSLIIHVELAITGGHVLMGTDAPESMGFQLHSGNNMHINLEPDSREECERLYYALSAGGKITMELQDMFWGAYFGSFTDRYGIQWMVNCAQKS